MRLKLFLLFLGAILLRIIIIPIHFNGDIVTQAEWAQSLELRGTKGFYDRSEGFIERPNHPPLISLWYFLVPAIQGSLSLFLTNIGSFIAVHHLGANHILWYYTFVKWFGSDFISTLEQTSIRYGFMAVIKLLPVLADLLIGALIYFFAKHFNPKKALFYTALYLIFPLGFYISAYWGQTDPVSALLMALAFLTLYKKGFIASPVLFALSLNIKPTGVLFAPLFIYYYLYSKPAFKTVVISFISSLLIYFASLYPFTNENLIIYSQKVFQILFFTKKTFLSVSAYNFWFILDGFSKTLDSVKYLLFSAKIWGFLLTVGLNLIAFKLVRQTNVKSYLLAIFIVGFGGWLFLTNMYERYLFNGILALFFMSIVEKRYVKYFLILGLISLLNMLQGPLAPPQIIFLLNWNNNIFAKLLALVNIVIFLRIFYPASLASKALKW